MRKGSRAFTLIEILTVIAIIAILAAIIVPVYSRAKVSAFRSSDIASMNQLNTALGLYKADQGAYPPQLLGYVTLYSSGPMAGNVIPASSVKGFLYPNQADSILVFKPAYNKFTNTAITGTLNATSGVTFPNADPTGVGTSPILDLNGDGVVTAADDTAEARQAYGPADGDVCFSSAVQGVIAGSHCGDPGSAPINFYKVAGFDVSDVRKGGVTVTELRYTRFWTNYAIGFGAGLGQGSPFDDPRQLGYTDPPEDTVVTWDSMFREYGSSGAVQSGRHEIALTIGGSAKPANSPDFADFSWRQRRS